MSRKSELPQSRRHVMIYDEDWEFLVKHYGAGSPRASIGISGAIKHIIHQRVLGLKQKINEELDRARESGGASTGAAT